MGIHLTNDVSLLEWRPSSEHLKLDLHCYRDPIIRESVRHERYHRLPAAARITPLSNLPVGTRRKFRSRTVQRLSLRPVFWTAPVDLMVVQSREAPQLSRSSRRSTACLF